MMKKNILFLILFFITNFSIAGEIDMLLDALAEKGVISYGEAQKIKTETKEEIKKQIAKGKADTLPGWIQNLSIKGDIRLRYQNDQSLNTNTTQRHRARLRLKLGANTRITEGMKAGFGLATASIKTGSISSTVTVSTKTGTGTSTASGVSVTDAEPRSTNFTFGDSLSKSPLMVDYAYLEYEPNGWLKFLGGKFKNPIWNATDLLWDSDLNPDGIAIPMKFSINPNINLSFTPLFMIIDEISSSEKDPVMYTFQPKMDLTLSNIKIKTAVAYYVFGNVKGSKLDHSAKTNTGATTGLKNNYTTISPSIETNLSDIPVVNSISIFGDYVLNTDSSTNNTGYCAGVKFGDAKIKGRSQWSFIYMYRYLETDSWLDIFPDSDFYSGGTNCQGFEAIFQYGLSKNALISVDYYNMDKIIGNMLGTTKQLIQVDLVYKF